MKSFLCAVIVAGVLSGCNVNSSVSFHDGYRGGNTTAEPPPPGLGVSNGGYMRKPTALGNHASLSMGAPVSSVHATTSQSNKVYLNVSGQTSQ